MFWSVKLDWGHDKPNSHRSGITGVDRQKLAKHFQISAGEAEQMVEQAVLLCVGLAFPSQLVNR